MLRVPLHRSLIVKLFALISLLLLGTISVNAWQNGSTFYAQLMLRIQEKTMQNARLTANSVDAVVESWLSQMIVITNGISGMPKSKYNDMIGTLISSNKEFITFELISAEAGDKLDVLATARSPYGEDDRYTGQRAADVHAKIRTISRKWMHGVVKRGAEVTVAVQNLTSEAGVPVLAIALPFAVKESNSKLWAVLTVWQTKLFAALSNGALESALIVDGEGNVVSGSDPKSLAQRKLDLDNPVLAEARRGNAAFGFKDWTNPQGEKVLGAYARIARYDLIALTSSDGKPAYDAVKLIVTKTLLWAALLLLAAMFVSFVAARSITENLRLLMDVTVKIAGGEFKSRAPVHSRDEVGLLAKAVNHMGAQIETLLETRVEMARLESELQTAKIVQEQFFPRDLPQDALLNITSFFQPASECGGDWWGHYKLSERYHMLCIADATGHGVPAALVTAMVFAASSILSRQIATREQIDGALGSFLREVNHTLCASGTGSHTMTLFVAMIDMETGILTYANGGHNFPLVVRKDASNPRNARHAKKGIRREMLQQMNSPLGIDPASTFGERTIQLDPGDKIFLYTDGLYECKNRAGDQWGKGRFLKAIEAAADMTAEEMKTAVVGAAYAHFAGEPADDDITVVCAELSRDWGAKAAVDELDLSGRGTAQRMTDLEEMADPAVEVKLPNAG